MSIFLDNFNSDAGWSKVGAWVDSSYSISSGVNTLTAGASADTSAWTRTGFEGRNVSITVRAGASLTGTPQIHLRESSSGNYLVAYVNPSDGTLNIGKVVAGTYTALHAPVAITGFSSAGSLTFTAKVWENLLFASVLFGTGFVDSQIESISADVNGFTGTSHGIGVTSGTQKYDWIDFRSLAYLTNVVCCGDSNVGFSGPTSITTYWPGLMMMRQFRDGFVSRNQGYSGNATSDFVTGKAGRIDPYLVTGARNILSIATGNNDYAQDQISAVATYAAQTGLIADCISDGWVCELATLIPFVYADKAGTTAILFVTDLNTLIRNGAVANNYTLCEIHDVFGATDGVDGVVPTTLRNADNIHYSAGIGQQMATRTHLRTLNRCERYSVT
jgi:hypothetical protein